MIVYGRNPVREALRGRRAVQHVWATKNAARESWLAEGASPPITISAADGVQRRCGSAAHQGICAQVEAFRYEDARVVLELTRPLILALDKVQDPQNLGAVCRSAECAGAAAVVISERRSAEVTAAVCKASAGAVEHLPVARVPNLANFVADAKEADFWCYGADQGGSTAYDEVDLRGPVVIVLGAEGRGLGSRVAGACDALVAIPVRGELASLNVSAAAAVLLYAADRQRGASAVR